jgi:hypothetical protein
MSLETRFDWVKENNPHCYAESEEGAETDVLALLRSVLDQLLEGA